MNHHNSIDFLSRINDLSAPEAVLELGSSERGLDSAEAEKRRKQYGPNEIESRKKKSFIRDILERLASPLIILLLVVATFSFFFGEKTSAIVVICMAVLSVGLSYFQENTANKNAERLRAMVKVTTTVWRDGKEMEVPLSQAVPGDLVELTAGKMVPADLRIISSKDLFVNQSALNGESFPIEKWPEKKAFIKEFATPFDLDTIICMGASIVSGSGRGVVIATGLQTQFGQLARELIVEDDDTSFEIGVRKYTWLMIKFIIILAGLIFIVNGVFKQDWIDSLLFSLAVAVGLTPDMMPMVIAINLSAGAQRMARKKVIIKRLDSIQNFGAMDILCTDKTGTLTLDQVVLVKHCDAAGNDDEEVFREAYLNSYFQTGLKNLLDKAIVNHKEFEIKSYRMIDEVPYDFSRKIMTVVIEKEGKDIMISKGAPEEIFARCSSFELAGRINAVNEEKMAFLMKKYDEFSQEGFRVLAVAYKPVANEHRVYTHEDENGLIFRGFVAFLDPPKPTTGIAIAHLEKQGIKMKILSGDNELVTHKICAEVGLSVEGALTGEKVDDLNDIELRTAAEQATIFTRFTPLQKERVIRALRANGHVVGFLGDGINDSPSLKAADVGISVDNAVDIAKETADIILLEKDLSVLCDCVKEGRRTFANTLKYIKMGASSNFGNMLSMTGASLLLPFLPMLPSQVLFNNFLYDLAQIPIPADNVDEDYLLKPRPWNIDFIKKFILFLGPVSSIFDFFTFAIMWYYFQAQPELFRTGWFVESLFTQTLVIYVIRTSKVPFLESSPSRILFVSTLAIIIFGCAVPFTPLGRLFGFVPLPAIFFAILLALALMYLLLAQYIKAWFVRKYGFD